MSGNHDGEEQRKIKQMYREKTSGQSKTEKVDFLYKDKVDSEEYLLGKRVDSNFERQNLPQKTESRVGAKFDDAAIKHNERNNMRIKERDDPLAAVRKNEEDARKALLNNPMKMKQLEKALKEKQNKRHSKDGDELFARYLAIKGAKVGVAEKKSKRKLPDDDKSLLYRYLELIGKARRKRFYSETSDEDDDRNYRAQHMSHSRGEGAEGRDGAAGRDGAEGREGAVGREGDSRHNETPIHRDRSNSPRGTRHDHRRNESGRRPARDRNHDSVDNWHGKKEISNSRDRQYSKGHETNEKISRDQQRSNQNIRYRDGRDKVDTRLDDTRQNSSRRELTRRNDTGQGDKYSRSTQHSRRRTQSRSASVDRKKYRSRSHSPRDRHFSTKTKTSDVKQEPRDHGARSNGKHVNSKSREQRSDSSNAKQKLNQSVKSRSRDRSTERQFKNQYAENREIKREIQSSRKTKDDIVSKRKSRSSSTDDEERKKQLGKNRKIKRPKTRTASSSSSSGSAGSDSTGSNNASASSSSDSGSSSDSRSSSGRKERTNKHKKILGPQRPPKASSNDVKRSEQSSPAEPDQSLEQLEKERDAIRSKLSNLPTYGLVHPKGDSLLEAKASSDAQRKLLIEKSKKKVRSPSPKHCAGSSRKRSRSKERLTKAEKEAKLSEMMDNAKWRDEQRSKNVARYEEEQRHEDETYAKNAGKDDFIAPMMVKHAGESSIEDQLKRNRHKIQRTSAATEKNFARK